MSLNLSTPHLPSCSRQWAILLIVPLLLLGCDDSPPKKHSRTATPHLVETTLAHQQTIAVVQTTSTTLLANRRVRVVMPISGLLTHLQVNPGDRVKRGQVLAQLDDSLLQVEVNKANTTLKQAQSDYQRLTNLAPRQLASKSEVALALTQRDLAAADWQLKRVQLAQSQITAPISGLVSQRIAQTGDVLATHSHLLTLVDTSRLKAHIQISELLLPWIDIDNPVDITIDALGEQRFSAHIERIYPTINPDTRHGTIEISLSPVPKGALAGQLCRIRIHTLEKSRLMIPFDAVRHDKQGAYVFTLNKTKALRQNIKTGIQHHQQIEVLEGLNENQAIISKGLFGLKNAMAVSIKKATKHPAKNPIKSTP